MSIADKFCAAAAAIERGEAVLCWSAMAAADIPSRYRGDFGEIFRPDLIYVALDAGPIYAWRATALCLAAAMYETGDL
jgi:hypothetical protein